MADFFKTVAPTLKAEGGLSKSQFDSAKADPVPDGSGYHTNKGITWATFKGLASKLGYVATPKLFYEMPNALWLKIAKVGYWDTLNGDKIQSSAVAYAFFTHGFMSGPNVASERMQAFLNRNGYNLVADGVFGAKSIEALNNAVKKNENSFFEAYVKATKTWLLSLPKQQDNYKGWGKRMDELLNHGFKIIIDNPVTSASTGGVFFLALGAFLFRKQIIKLFTSKK